ncbi:MAG: hypothetical protein ACRYFZ_05240 [Janthinobacterium lividum]
MRTSTAWLLAAALLLVAALATYNVALHQAYQRQLTAGDPDAYVRLASQDFTEVVLPDSGSLGVKITRGPFRVQVRAQYAHLVHLRQQGRQLIVTTDSSDVLEDEEMLLISCPRLTRVTTRSVGPSPTAAGDSEGRCGVAISGFRSDSLTLYQAKRARILLFDNRLKHLRATVGANATSYADLELHDDNRIAAAELVVNGHSRLSADGFIIPRLRYQFADSAVVQLLGGTLPHQRRQ